MDDIDRAAKAINEQKGEAIALRCLVNAIFRAMPLSQQAGALADFDNEREIAKTVLLNSNAPDDVLRAFDHAIAALNALRLDQPKD